MNWYFPLAILVAALIYEILRLLSKRKRQYEIIQRHSGRPWESILGPYWDRATAYGALVKSVLPGQPNPDYRLVRAPGVEYRVVPVGERP